MASRFHERDGDTALRAFRAGSCARKLDEQARISLVKVTVLVHYFESNTTESDNSYDQFTFL